jgi:hypothetical protein
VVYPNLTVASAGNYQHSNSSRRDVGGKINEDGWTMDVGDDVLAFRSDASGFWRGFTL